MELVKSNHNSTRQQNYTISEMLNNSGMENIIKLFDYKPKYVIGLFDTYALNRTNAIALPGQEQIVYGHVIVRLSLKEYGVICCANFQKLKGSIKGSFPKNVQTAMFNLAGMRYYEAASNDNWDSVEQMNVLMIAFMADTGRMGIMTAALEIASTFQASVASDSTNFHDEHTLMNAAKQTATATSAKITADNLVYSNSISLCEDAQIALEGFPDLQKLFVYETLKNIIAPPGSASYKLTAEMAGTFLKRAGLTVTIQEEGHPAMVLITDINGEVHFEHINPAKYLVKITGEGIISQTFYKDVDTGVNAHSEVIMSLLSTVAVAETDEAVAGESGATKEVEGAEEIKKPDEPKA